MKKHFFLRPLDTLFFRDGRPFGEASKSSSGFPTPQTLYGAVLTAILSHLKANFERSRDFTSDLEFLKNIIPSAPWLADLKLKGPWLAKKTNSSCEVFYNTPSILLKSKNESDSHCFLTLPKKPLEVPGWDSQDGLRPLWTTKVSSEPASGYLNHEGIRKLLNGMPVVKTDITFPEKSGSENPGLFSYQNRTGIGINPDTNTTEESIIYSASHLCMEKDHGFAFEIEIPDAGNSAPWESLKTLSWGGENKKVFLEPVSEFNHPVATMKPGWKPFVVLTTPALFHPERPWRPECFQKTLCAASIPSNFCVSGWNFRTGGPKPTRFGIPAGSTFFLENESEIPSTGSLCGDETSHAGWGCFLKGVWKDE